MRKHLQVNAQRRRLTLAAGGGLLASWLAPAAAAAAAASAGAEAKAPACLASPEWADLLRRDLDLMALNLTRTLTAWPVPARVFQPEAFGLAAGGTGALATAAIQRAIDACAAAGGGTVRLAGGDYVSGTIDLRSGVMLEIAEGSRLLASTDLKDYPDRLARRLTVMDSNMGMNQSLIFAQDCERVGICGKGVIDGRGTLENFPGEETISGTPGRPFLIRMLDCRNVVMKDISLRDSPCWMQNYLNCEDLLIDGIRVENQSNHNNDGLDIDSCRRVIVRNCWINSGDDALCFKGAGQRAMENILVENCQFFSSCNALKFGTDSQGDFRNILVRNVVLGGPADTMRSRKRRKSDGGVSWEIVDGGTLERVLVHDAHIVRSESPLFLYLGDRGRVRPGEKRPPPGNLRHIVFDRVTGDDNGVRGSFFTGIQAKQIEHVLLRDVAIRMAPAKEPAIKAADVPISQDIYPDPHMYSTVMPAYGLWTRHVRDLTLLRVRFTNAGKDARPAMLAGLDTAIACHTGRP